MTPITPPQAGGKPPRKHPEGEKHETKANDKAKLSAELQKRRETRKSEEHVPPPDAGRMASLNAMACFSPLTGYRSRSGLKLTFRKSEGYIDQPVKVACGQCRGCRKEKARQWAVRCMHEAQMHARKCFLTLTYSEEKLPADRSVNVRHWQLFAKRLRKEKGPFRFYHCGEYGETTGRPHYHALIYGLDFYETRERWKKSGNGHWLYIDQVLNELWSHGHVYIGELTHESAAYCARYTMKKLSGDTAETEYGERVDPDTGEVSFYRARPYSTMSRRPGIGHGWLEKFKGDVYPSDEVIANGRKTKPPTYYDSKLEEEDPELLESIKAERRKNGNKHKSNNTPDRLAVREESDRLKDRHKIREPK